MKQKRLEFDDQLQEKRQIGFADRATERTDIDKISQADTNPETSHVYLLLLVMVVVIFRLRFTFQVGGYLPASWRLFMLWTFVQDNCVWKQHRSVCRLDVARPALPHLLMSL